ncbi:hypothetical protein PGT21_026198 [Puccinia graminis f. sp. tritici]|uniref:Uncharacterized protein n=1 Tax=Puccinia graminis f. sp. tritici TaxID=56615 RepID=A0A5B0MD06_PUCGR|nr:hypothetical protein PGT21_026198 [Puccinia graminis f. sp. tritici]
MQSFEEVDPSLLLASQDPTFSVPSLNSIASKPPPNKKHTRRTKKQMALARGEDITNNEQTASQKSHKLSQRQRGSQKKGTQSTQKTITENDNNPQFILTDYKNICSYLEDDKKFSKLYGDTKTNVGPKLPYISLIAKKLVGQKHHFRIVGEEDVAYRQTSWKVKNFADEIISIILMLEEEEGE